MALSSGVRQAAGMAAAWVLVGSASAFSVVYFQDIKQGARTVLGVSAAEPVTSTPPTAKRRPEVATQQSLSRGRTVEIRAGSYGHYFASVEVNGRPIDVMVDSGASIVAMTFEDARRAGIHVSDRDFTQRVSTANGLARVAPVMLGRVSIGDITVRNVPAAVAEPGNLSTTLLGMSFLGRLQRVDMRSGVLHLQE